MFEEDNKGDDFLKKGTDDELEEDEEKLDLQNDGDSDDLEEEEEDENSYMSAIMNPNGEEEYSF